MADWLGSAGHCDKYSMGRKVSITEGDQETLCPRMARSRTEQRVKKSSARRPSVWHDDKQFRKWKKENQTWKPEEKKKPTTIYITPRTQRKMNNVSSFLQRMDSEEEEKFMIKNLMMKTNLPEHVVGLRKTFSL